MARFNTGNPIDSKDPRDLSDNAQNIDQWANAEGGSFPDRLGVNRRTLAGMDAEFQSFLDGSAYEFLGDYAADIEVTSRNQVIRESGEFWRVAADTELPYTTTGAGMPEGGAFVAVGDAVLRQDLQATDSFLQDVNNSRGFAQSVASVEDLRDLTIPDSLERIWLEGYYGPGTPGGGPLRIDRDDTTSADNGGTVFVNGDGLRFKRPVSDGLFYLEQWGVREGENNKTENGQIISTILDDAIANGGHISALRGEYHFEGVNKTLSESGGRNDFIISGHGRYDTALVFHNAPGTQVFSVSGTFAGFQMLDLQVRAPEGLEKEFDFIVCPGNTNFLTRQYWRNLRIVGFRKPWEIAAFAGGIYNCEQVACLHGHCYFAGTSMTLEHVYSFNCDYGSMWGLRRNLETGEYHTETKIVYSSVINGASDNNENDGQYIIGAMETTSFKQCGAEADTTQAAAIYFPDYESALVPSVNIKLLKIFDGFFFGGSSVNNIVIGADRVGAVFNNPRFSSTLSGDFIAFEGDAGFDKPLGLFFNRAECNNSDGGKIDFDPQNNPTDFSVDGRYIGKVTNTYLSNTRPQFSFEGNNIIVSPVESSLVIPSGRELRLAISGNLSGRQGLFATISVSEISADAGGVTGQIYLSASAFSSGAGRVEFSLSGIDGSDVNVTTQPSVLNDDATDLRIQFPGLGAGKALRCHVNATFGARGSTGRDLYYVYDNPET